MTSAGSAGASGSEIVGVLLAAGRARRFGRDKRLLALPSGVPMVVASARALLRAVGRALVVLRPDDQTLGRILVAEGLETVHCPDCDQGMGASIACGVRHVGRMSAYLIALADMPYLRADTIRQVADALRAGHPLVAPFYEGRRGHPVGFASVFRPELMALSGKSGAATLLRRHGSKLYSIATIDLGVVTDVDVPEDLHRNRE